MNACRRITLLAALALACLGAAPAVAPAQVTTGGASPDDPALRPPGKATLTARGLAVPPPDAPPEVVKAIRAANRIARKPYRYGGGHASFRDRGYDCSGAVSYVLHGAGLLDSPLDSRQLMRWGKRGKGRWITVYSNRGHAFIVIAGLRFDPGARDELARRFGRPGSGPRWAGPRSTRGYRVRHFPGL